MNAGQGAKDIEEFLPEAVRVPFLEVVVHRFPGREVVRQGAPGTTFPSMIEQGVDDLAQINLPRPTNLRTARAHGKEWLDKGPLLIRDIAGVGFTVHALFYAKPGVGNS